MLPWVLFWFLSVWHWLKEEALDSVRNCLSFTHWLVCELSAVIVKNRKRAAQTHVCSCWCVSLCSPACMWLSARHFFCVCLFARSGMTNARELHQFSSIHDFKARDTHGKRSKRSDTYPPPGMTFGVATRYIVLRDSMNVAVAEPWSCKKPSRLLPSAYCANSSRIRSETSHRFMIISCFSATSSLKNTLPFTPVSNQLHSTFRSDDRLLDLEQMWEALYYWVSFEFLKCLPRLVRTPFGYVLIVPCVTAVTFIWSWNFSCLSR